MQTKITKSANGERCTVRLEGCDGGGETTVFAHYSLSGFSGRGFKSPEYMGAYCCFRCHNLIDGREHIANLTRNDVRLAFAEGVFRTQAKLIDKGLLVVK
jgi:hypothetical protein